MKRLFSPQVVKIITTVITAYVILGISLLIIAYGRGYRFNFKNKSVGSTGLITATSDPIGAFVSIDGKRYGATNTNIPIQPGWYEVTIAKDAYQPWSKKIRVQGEILAKADAMLFPINPSLSAITTSGVVRPVLSPDGTKLAYNITPNPQATLSATPLSKPGLYVLDLVDKPLGINRDARQILAASILNTEDATLTWSPDGKQILIETTATRTGLPQYYLVDSDRTNAVPTPVGVSEQLTTEWGNQKALIEHERLLPLKEDFINTATASMNILSFSPDELKILYEATDAATIPIIITPRKIGTNSTEETRDILPGNLYVYDVKEDKNYNLGSAESYGIISQKGLPQQQKLSSEEMESQTRATSIPLQWLPTSRHLILAGSDKIDIMEYDGTNRTTVYAGPFEDGFVVPWTNASKLVILTNLNPKVQENANLYTVNIR